MNIERDLPELDAILQRFHGVIGADYEAYRNHVHRMLNFCFFLHSADAMERQKLIIAGAFHDIGIWTDNTLDYLPPSIDQAKTYLTANGLPDWQNEISLIIDQHHKLRAYRGNNLVEIFRRGDLVDVSLGMIKCGVPKSAIAAVKDAFPNAGFHKLLLRSSWRQFKAHPSNPAPMMKW